MALLRAGVALLLAAPGTAAGHARSTSTSSWDVETGAKPRAEVTLRATWPDLQRTLPALGGVTPEDLRYRPGLAAQVDAYLSGALRLLAGGEPCAVDGPVRRFPSADPTHVTRRWRIACSAGGDLLIRADPFLEAVSSHLHLARIRLDGAPAVERVFVIGATAAPLAAGPAPVASDPGAFVKLGVEHIATGWDHLLFLLALLLAGFGLAEVATVVTGFTVAHSLTLALGVLGWVEPEGRVVESLIALSIGVVSVENTLLTLGATARRQLVVACTGLFALAVVACGVGGLALPALPVAGVGLFSLCYFGLVARARRGFRLRWLLAFVFGLVHGFGFAGFLTEMALPPERLALALLGFNVGVELGQLAAVVAVWPLLRFGLRKAGGQRTLVIQAGSAAVLAASLFWFAERALP